MRERIYGGDRGLSSWKSGPEKKERLKKSKERGVLSL
jgi:hypothetical protein